MTRALIFIALLVSARTVADDERSHSHGPVSFDVSEALLGILRDVVDRWLAMIPVRI